MEEDALLSDPVENSAEVQAAVLAQSKPFDEGQFPAWSQIFAKGQALDEGQPLLKGHVLDEDGPIEEDKSSEEDVAVNEELVFEYLNQGVAFGEVKGLDILTGLQIQGPHLEDI